MDVIIGAGITGLSYAAFKKGGDYLILEAEPRIGGYCKSTKRNGFVWDYSGHFFHFRDAALKEMFLGSLPAGEKEPRTKRTNIRYGGGYVDYPFQKNIHQLPKDEFIECLVDLFDTNTEGYTNFEEMLYAKFGKGISDRFLIPYNRKLYAVDLNVLDKDAMGRFFPYASKEDIIRNFRSNDNSTYNDTFIYPASGAETYVEKVAALADSRKIICNARVDAVDLELKTVHAAGKEYCYDRLISTAPLPDLLRLTGTDVPENAFSWNKVLVFNIGFDSKGPDRTTSWTYFPENKYRFYRVGFYDNILDTDRTSVYVEIGFGKDDRIDVEAEYARVLEDLVKAGCISPGQKVAVHEALVMDPAYVHITSEGIALVDRMKRMLEQRSVYTIGRYGSWTYCSIEDNIMEARALAQKLNP